MDIDAEIEEEIAMLAEDEVGPPPPEDGEPSPPGTPHSSSPASSPEGSPLASPATSPPPLRPPSPATLRRQAIIHADCTEGDEDEPIGEMAERLHALIKEGEAQHERKRRIQARSALPMLVWASLMG